MVKNEATTAIGTLERVLTQKIRGKKKELAQWQARLQEAARNEELCLREISEMEMAIAVFRRAFGLESEVPPTDELDILRYRNQTIAESCLDIMRKNGGRARVTEITRTLLKAGKIRNYRTGYAVVTKTLDRDERFRRKGRGEFEIADRPQERLLD